MRYIKNFEANFTDSVKDIFKNDIYYSNKDDYNYKDGFSRYFKKVDIVVLVNKNHFYQFEDGDKLKILRMIGQNAKVINLRNKKIDVLSLSDLLSEKDYELYNSKNKYNL